MRILKYASDLHTELGDGIDHLQSLWNFVKFPKHTYYLALLGDIGNPLNKYLKKFLEKISPMYEKIFYIPGNHEYYNDNWIKYTRTEMYQKLVEIVNEFPNIILMNNNTFELDEFKIIGTTLWTKVPSHARRNVKQQINDYRCIGSDIDKGTYAKYPITIDETNTWNKESVEWLKNELITDKPCIVLTHHAPLYNNRISGNYTSRPEFTSSNICSAFQNDLSLIIKTPIRVWLYGHTHHSSIFEYNNVIIATNQLGYSCEGSLISFDPYAFINLENVIVEHLKEIKMKESADERVKMLDSL